MLVYLSCAKLMSSAPVGRVEGAGDPLFQAQAERHVLNLMSLTIDDWSEQLHIKREMAAEVWHMYQHFFERKADQRLPAAFAYNGMVFRKLSVPTLTAQQLEYAQEHVLIASFLYGMLRPLDLICPYRLEGKVVLPDSGGENMFAFWKTLLTDFFIQRIKENGGVLVNLASKEMQQMVDWRKVKKHVRVITPEFRVWKDGRLRNIVIYTKMCRGAMTRFILQRQFDDPEELKYFSFEGFQHDSESGEFFFCLK